MTPTVPAALKSDRNVAPFLARSAELADANPVVSYYCKVYVLDHILNNKLHQTSGEVEAFTIALLDDTENIKAAHPDESVRQVLASKQLSVNLVFVFAFKLFHSCLEDLGNYDGAKVPLATKLRATINFWALFAVFAGSTEKDPIDFAKTTGGTCTSEDQFFAFTKEKLKTLKFQLSRLIKDEVPVKGEERELAELETSQSSDLPDLDVAALKLGPEASAAEEAELQRQLDALTKDSFAEARSQEPAGHKDSGDADNAQASEPEESPFSLPGAPKFEPGSESDAGPQLPGAPKFLPDGDLPQINKKSTIQVFTEPAQPPAPAPLPRKPSNVTHVTKETLGAIVDTTEQMGKIQKHAKFAISALNYEDLATAEDELVKGLELLRALKERM